MPAAALRGFFFSLFLSPSLSEHITHFCTFIAHMDWEATGCFFRNCSWQLIRVTSRDKQKIKRLPFYLHYTDHLLFGHFCTFFNMWIQEMVTSHLLIGRYPWNACGSGVVVFRHLLFYLLHSLLKMNLNQDKFSLLDEGHFFFQRRLKLFNSNTCCAYLSIYFPFHFPC